MAVFMLTAQDEERLQAAKRFVLANVIPLDVVKRIAKAASEDSDGVVHGERPADVPVPRQVVLEGGWRVALSCEEQPIGRCLHLSISSPTPIKTVPRTEALKMVLDALGVGQALTVWFESFKEGGVVAGKAINALVAAP